MTCLITRRQVSGSRTSAPPERVFFFSEAIPVRFFSYGGGARGGWARGRAAVRQAPLMQAFTKPPSLRLRIRSRHAFTTPKTPPRCFGLASDGLPRRPQIHQAYKSCIAFVFVWLINDLVVRHTHTRIARIMQKPKDNQRFSYIR